MISLGTKILQHEVSNTRVITGRHKGFRESILQLNSLLVVVREFKWSWHDTFFIDIETFEAKTHTHIL